MAPSKGEEGVVQIMFSPKGPAFLTWIVQMVMEDWGDDEGLRVHEIQLEFNFGPQIQTKPRLKRNKYIFKIPLGTLATDPTGQLNVLGKDGHAFGVDGIEVGVLEETNQVGL